MTSSPLKVAKNTFEQIASQTSDQRQDSITITANNLATTHLKQTHSQNPAPLKAAETPSENLKTVYELIGNQQYEEARNLLESFKPAEENPINSANCHIAMARTYPGKVSDSEPHVKEAKSLLDDALAKTLQLPMRIETKINYCQIIRSIYKDMASLEAFVPSDDLTFFDDVKEKIEECSKHIPHLFDFYDKLALVKELPKESKPEDVKKITDDALQILEQGTLSFFLAKAISQCLIAKALPKGSERAENSKSARHFALGTYEKIDTFIRACGAPFVYEKFGGLFLELKSLFPKDVQIKQIYSQLRAKSQNGKGKTSRKVTKGPVGNSWKTLGILATLAFAFAFISTVVLGRRYFSILRSA